MYLTLREEFLLKILLTSLVLKWLIAYYFVIVAIQFQLINVNMTIELYNEDWADDKLVCLHSELFNKCLEAIS